MLRIVALVCLATTVVLGHPTNNKIVGGSDAVAGQFPSVVSLQYARNKDHFCGGALISDRIVMTAGHCLVNYNNPNNTVVYVGSIHNTKGGTYHNVSRIVVHEKYGTGPTKNDISLVKLSEPVTFSENVQPIGLPRSNEETDAGTIVTAVGWGDDHVAFTDALHFVELGVVGNDECSDRMGNHVPITNLCVGGVEGYGLCFGDSGSPLISGNTTLGIVSYGKACAIGYPDVFTRVAAFVGWIHKNQADLEAYV